MKEFFITAYDRSFSRKIDSGAFSSLRDAKKTIMEAMSGEEKFDVMMENYVELEKAIFDIAMDHLAFNNVLPSGEIRRLTSRRLMNFLSSTRLYRHAIIGNLKRITRCGADVDKLRSLINDGSDVPIAYRIMEAVRNFSQHQDLPISGFLLSSEWEDVDSKDFRSAHTAVPSISTAPIAEDRETPREVSDALSRLGPSIHIMPMVRKSLEHYGEIHDTFRKNIEVKIKASSDLINTTIADAFVLKEPSIRLLIARAEDSGQRLDDFQLFPELIENLSALRRKNLSQVNLSRRYVRWTGEINK